jgi:hypothetical protein
MNRKKPRQRQQQPLMYITQNMVGQVEGKMQSHVRIKLNPKEKQEVMEQEGNVETNEIEKKKISPNARELEKVILEDSEKAEITNIISTIEKEVKETEESEEETIQDEQGVIGKEEIEVIEEHSNNEQDEEKIHHSHLNKSYIELRKEIQSRTFHDLGIVEKVEILASLPKYINHVLVELRANNRLIIGRIYSYLQEEQAILIFNNNNLKMIRIEIKDIETLKVISL